MDLFFFQSFFDKLSGKFIPPLLSGLNYFTFQDHNGSLDFLDEGEGLVIDYILNNLHITNATIDPEPSIVTIKNGFVTFAFQNLAVNLTSDYQFMANPPIFGDIGEANLNFARTNFSSDMTSYLHTDPNTFEVTMSNLNTSSLHEPFSSFDGISDFSSVSTNVLNTVVGVLRNRVISMVNGNDLYTLDNKIETTINKIIALVPVPLYIGDKGLYLDGFLYD